MTDTTNNGNSRAKSWALGSALAGAGLIVGIVTAGTFAANAATTTPAPAAGSSTSQGVGPGGGADSATSVRPDEKLLTGDTADKVKAAALAKYPDATVIRIESDSDGVYEAHLRKSDGTPVTVEVNDAFEVTGEEAGGPPPSGAQGGPQGAPQGAPDANSNATGSAYSG